MAQKIKILDTPYFDQEVTLSSQPYNLLMKYNQSDDSWYLTVRTKTKEVITSGLKLLPDQNITYSRQYLDIMPNGNLYCLRVKANDESLGRDTLGIGKTYELWWIPTSEEEELGIDGRIQL